MKSLLFITLPVLMLAHSVAVTFSVHANGRGVISYFCPDNLLDFLCSRHVVEANPSIYLYSKSMSMMLVLFALGLCLTCLNASVGNLVECVDPVCCPLPNCILRFDVASLSI